MRKKVGEKTQLWVSWKNKRQHHELLKRRFVVLSLNENVALFSIVMNCDGGISFLRCLFIIQEGNILSNFQWTSILQRQPVYLQPKVFNEERERHPNEKSRTPNVSPSVGKFLNSAKVSIQIQSPIKSNSENVLKERERPRNSNSLTQVA